MPANIYIVEDHPLMQHMMVEFINQLPDLHVCGVGGTAKEALTHLSTRSVDLVVIDLSLPDQNGIELLKLVKQQWPTLPCLMFSSYEETAYVQQAFAAGVGGYLFKGDPDELVLAIRHVLEGKSYRSTSSSTI